MLRKFVLDYCLLDAMAMSGIEWSSIVYLDVNLPRKMFSEYAVLWEILCVCWWCPAGCMYAVGCVVHGCIKYARRPNDCPSAAEVTHPTLFVRRALIRQPCRSHQYQYHLFHLNYSLYCCRHTTTQSSLYLSLSPSLSPSAQHLRLTLYHLGQVEQHVRRITFQPQPAGTAFISKTANPTRTL